MSDDGKVPACPSRIQPLLVLRYSLVRGNVCQSYAEEDCAELRKRDIRSRGHSVCAGLPLLAKPALGAARRSRSSHALSHRVSGTDLLQSTSPALELEAAWLVAQRKPSPNCLCYFCLFMASSGYQRSKAIALQRRRQCRDSMVARPFEHERWASRELTID